MEYFWGNLQQKSVEAALLAEFNKKAYCHLILRITPVKNF